MTASYDDRNADLTTTETMKYKLLKKGNAWFFQCNSWLKAEHGPFKTREQAKAEADAYVKNF